MKKIVLAVMIIVLLSLSLFASPGKHIIKKDKAGVYYIYDGGGKLLLKTKDIKHSDPAYDLIGDNQYDYTSIDPDTGDSVVYCHYLGKGCINACVAAH